MESEVKRIMQEARVPGLAIAVVENGQVLFSRGLGSTGKDALEPVTDKTIFEAASLTKPMFAYLVLALRDRGLLDLDKPISHYLPGFDICPDERYKQITPRHVLSHSGGWQNWRRREELKIHFAPGTGFRYSGEGYVYLQRAVEQLTGESIDVTLHSLVLDPLGLKNSSLVWSESTGLRISNCFDENGKGEEPHPIKEPNVAYSLYTTAEDYIRFVLEFLQPGQSLLPPKSLAEMLTPRTMVSNHLRWSLGWGVIDGGTMRQSFWHWGDNGNFTSFVWFCPGESKALLLLTNSANGLTLTHEVMHHMSINGTMAFSEFLCNLYESELRIYS